MLFSSFDFLFLFLPVVLLLFWISSKISKTATLAFGIAASLFFYGYFKPIYLPILIGSLVFNYAVGTSLRKKPSKRLLIFGVVADLGLLGFFKYAGLFARTADLVPGVDMAVPHIALPLAISFFTFQQIAYIVDSYRGTTIRTDFLRHAFFVTFFPHLIAGPIVQQQDITEELNEKKLGLEKERFALGISVFTLGLFKKVAIADVLAAIADPIFNANAAGRSLDAVTAWMGTFAYTFQIYFDFSAYSDMAIGLALLVGLHFPLNFNSPYKSSSIIEFWRRWHITLSRFLRDYLYISLGGNRRGIFGRYGNLMLTMLLGGLWHGADWAFVLWGGLHGLFLVVNHGWRNRVAPRVPKAAAFIGRYLGVPITFLLVALAWVPFRANGTDFVPYFKSMFAGGFDIGHYPGMMYGATSAFGWSVLACAALIAFFLPNVAEFMGYKEWAGTKVGVHRDVPETKPLVTWSRSPFWAVVMAVIAAFSLILVLRGAPNAFIYFEF